MEKLLVIITCATGIVLIVTAFIQIIYRFVIGDALPWPDELCQYAFMWSSLMGSVVVMADNEHLRVDAFINLLPKSVHKYFDGLCLLVMAGFSAFTCWAGYEYTYELYDMEQIAQSMPELKIWVVALCIPISFFLTTLFALRNFFRLFTQKHD